MAAVTANASAAMRANNETSAKSIPTNYPAPTRIPAVPSDQLPEYHIRKIHDSISFCFSRLTAMFFSRTTISEEVYDQVYEQLVLQRRQCAETATAREWVGCSLNIWWDYWSMLSQAIPCLKSQVFFPIETHMDPQNPRSVTAHMCANAATLHKDIAKLEIALRIGYALLLPGNAPKIYCQEAGVDQKVLQLLEVCIRVCARSMDVEPNSAMERTAAEISNKFKSLMVCCFKFLHNSIMHNESRMLSFWTDLFGFPMDQPLGTNAENNLSLPLDKPPGLNFMLTNVFEYKPDPEMNPNEEMPRLRKVMRALRAVHLVSLKDDVEDRRLAADFTERSVKLLGDLDDAEESSPKRADVLSFFREILSPDQFKEKPTTESMHMHMDERLEMHRRKKRILVRDVPIQFPELHPANEHSYEPGPDHEVHEAMQSLQVNDNQPNGEHPYTPDHLDGEEHEHELEEHEEEEEEDEEEDEEESDNYVDESEPEEPDDYDPLGASHKPRGLLAEAALLLGPTEIEAFMMILMNGLRHQSQRPSSASENPTEKEILQGIRCNLLVFSEQGRHLLRELLIFIAAWDLQEDDMYFKLLANIVTSVLSEGYLTLAYNGFREHRDIVSPAQSTLIKMLTFCFRMKKERGPPYAPDPGTSENDVTERLQRDRTVVYDMVNEFRIHVIPRTLAYIWLQGKIHAGIAIPDDFPLNLWDVERIYEGVYQFLEFFALLAETSTWKQILVSQEIVLELIELLKVLDSSVPKDNARSGAARRQAQHQAAAAAAAAGDPPPIALAVDPEGRQYRIDEHAGPIPVAVERPFDTNVESPTTAAAGSPPPSQGHHEPVEAWNFEWRNMKKLIILVLSSLVWHTPSVKRQIRDLGGVELIMGCCNYDGYNQYIREHALICLQFLVEDTAAEQALRLPA